MGGRPSQNKFMAKDAPLSRRDRNLADIRERAIMIAERIVLERGSDALSARGLATALNVSVGSLYNAFGDLDGVVRAVNAKCARMLSASLAAAVAGAAPDARARVVALGEAYFDFAIAEPERWWMLVERRSDAAPDLKTHDLQAGLLDMLVRAGDGAPIRAADRQFFLLLWASVHGLVSLACRPTIVAMDPGAARTYIRDLVDAAFDRRPMQTGG
jgi:AcrR family transcriptional regulator